MALIYHKMTQMSSGISTAFLTAPVLLTVVCSLMVYYWNCSGYLNFTCHFPLCHFIPTSKFLSLPSTLDLYSWLVEEDCYWLCSLPLFLPESLAKFHHISEKQKISAWLYLTTKRNFLRSWSQRCLHMTNFLRFKTNIKARLWTCSTIQSNLLLHGLPGRKKQAELFRIFFF